MPKAGPITVNQDILRAVGLVRTLNKPLKILGAGELTVPLFVVADAFTGSARSKIEAAGGSVNVLEVPTSPLAALGVDDDETARTPREPRTAAGRAAVDKEVVLARRAKPTPPKPRRPRPSRPPSRQRREGAQGRRDGPDADGRCRADEPTTADTAVEASGDERRSDHRG